MLKVKDWIKIKRSQFEIIERGKPGGEILYETFDSSGKEYKEKLSSEIGIIKAIRRIKDSSIFILFEISDALDSFFIGFSEDLIHCTILNLNSQETEYIEVDEIQSEYFFDEEKMDDLNFSEESKMKIRYFKKI